MNVIRISSEDALKLLSDNQKNGAKFLTDSSKMQRENFDSYRSKLKQEKPRYVEEDNKSV